MTIRVVSLVPSVTETLLAWGVEPVACTRFCEQPSLAHVGGTKDPDVEAIVALRPDLVVMDEEENRREDAAAIESAGLTVLATAVRSIADVAPTLDALTTALGRERRSERALLTESGAGEGDGGRRRKRAFVPIWRNPWMTINRETYGSSLLAAIGIDNVYADDGDRYPTIELDDATGRRPDLVIAPSEPYPFSERQRPELERVAPATYVDGRDLFWWGVRTAGALERLSRALAPRPDPMGA